MTYAVLREIADVAVGNDKVLTNAEGIGVDAEIIQVDVTATATVGTRTIDVEIRDALDVVLASITLANVTASQTPVFNIYPGSTDGELPPFGLREGFDLHVVDTADIDVADTIAVRAFVRGAAPSAARSG